MSTILDTIRSLKPGDRVRVTKEQSVVEVNKNGSVWLDAGVMLTGLWPDDPTITSIEVIETAFSIGEEVVWANGDGSTRYTIQAIVDDTAWVKTGSRNIFVPVSDLRRAS